MSTTELIKAVQTGAVVPKGEFARLLGRDASFVSRNLPALARGGALEGAGRNARVRVAQAVAELGITLDLGQQLGQAASSLLEVLPHLSSAPPREDAAAPAPGPGATKPGTATITAQVAAEKLEDLRLGNEIKRRTLLEKADAFRDRREVEHAMFTVARQLRGRIQDHHRRLADTIAEELRLDRAKVRAIVKRLGVEHMADLARLMSDLAAAEPELDPLKDLPQAGEEGEGA